MRDGQLCSLGPGHLDFIWDPLTGLLWAPCLLLDHDRGVRSFVSGNPHLRSSFLRPLLVVSCPRTNLSLYTGVSPDRWPSQGTGSPVENPLVCTEIRLCTREMSSTSLGWPWEPQGLARAGRSTGQGAMGGQCSGQGTE